MQLLTSLILSYYIIIMGKYMRKGKHDMQIPLDIYDALWGFGVLGFILYCFKMSYKWMKIKRSFHNLCLIKSIP